MIRRLSFDQTGLPPSPEQIAEFLADRSPNAHEKLVDRMLDSPYYGERLATFWLDLVRYADSDGYCADHYRSDAWRYRDYVIHLLNADKPCDRFVREQLAGDEIDPDAGSKWDSHSKMEENHSRQCLQSDSPTAGLLKDLKSRGLLDDTLVIWGGEFDRTPMSETEDGRGHNPTGFTMCMAGGVVQDGQVIGATDELGLWATEDRLHVHDLHATILHLLGIHNLDLI